MMIQCDKTEHKSRNIMRRLVRRGCGHDLLELGRRSPLQVFGRLVQSSAHSPRSCAQKRNQAPQSSCTEGCRSTLFMPFAPRAI